MVLWVYNKWVNRMKRGEMKKKNTTNMNMGNWTEIVYKNISSTISKMAYHISAKREKSIQLSLYCINVVHMHTCSHTHIFIRFENLNLKASKTMDSATTLCENVPQQCLQTYYMVSKRIQTTNKYGDRAKETRECKVCVCMHVCVCGMSGPK